MKATLLVRINERQSIVDRHTAYEPIVLCSYFDPEAEEGSQWIWGHYFATIAEAINYLIEDGADVSGLVKFLANTIEKQSEEKKPSECERYAEAIREELYNIYNGNETNDEGEPKTFYDWAASDVLDLFTITYSDGEYQGTRAAVTLGGPNAYVDTFRNSIEVYWGAEHVEIWLPCEISNEIDMIFSEFYACR